MPRTTTPRALNITPPKWTPEELMKVRHLGPGIIGQEKFDAAQAYVTETHGGAFGPALLGSAAHSQAGPTKIVDGKLVFAADAR